MDIDDNFNVIYHSKNDSLKFERDTDGYDTLNKYGETNETNFKKQKLIDERAIRRY